MSTRHTERPAWLKKLVPSRLVRYMGDPSTRAVALTFDDGPIPKQTEAILDLLRDEGVKATFFVVGKAAEAHPQVVRRIAREGHQVGNHSYSHPRLGVWNCRAVWEEFGRVQRFVRDLTGRAPRAVRAPFGQVTPTLVCYSLLHDLSLMSWSLDTLDSLATDRAEVLARLARRPIKAGDIILCHDDSAFALDLVPRIISAVRTQGLGFQTVEEISRKRPAAY